MNNNDNESLKDDKKLIDSMMELILKWLAVLFMFFMLGLTIFVFVIYQLYQYLK